MQPSVHGERKFILIIDQPRLVVVVGPVAPGEIRKYYREQMGALVHGATTELRKPLR
jgi:hypothetical protein